MANLHPVHDYAERVVSGEIAACKWVRLACERHLRDLETGVLRGLRFDEDAADRTIQFFGFLRHSKGEWAGCKFELAAWQQFIIGNIFGWLRSDGLRRFRTAYIEVPRKNGKSTLLAGVALYMLVGDEEPGAEVYTAATKRDQAKIIWTEAANMVRASPTLKKRISVLRSRANMSIEATACKFEALGADADTLDGLNIHCATVDELHAHKDRDTWDKLETGTGSRRQPLLVAITTAGSEQDSICYEQRDYVSKVLRRIFEDDTYFGYIACADESDDWRDPAVWAKANPNLGVSVKLDDLERKAAKAKETPAAQAAFMRLHLDIWTQAESPLIPMDKWDACAGLVVPEALKGRVAYGAYDLSANTDITAAVLVLPADDGMIDALPHFWMPQIGLDERIRKDGVRYDLWAKQGYITLIPKSELIDDQFVRQWFLRQRETINIKQIVFDKWNALSLAADLGNDGFEMVEFPQTIANFSGPTKAMLELVIAGKLRHGGNPVLRWMADCLTVRQDANENIRPVKPERHKSNKRIDGMVALIMALSRAILKEPKIIYFFTIRQEQEAGL